MRRLQLSIIKVMGDHTQRIPVRGEQEREFIRTRKLEKGSKGEGRVI